MSAAFDPDTTRAAAARPEGPGTANKKDFLQ